MEGIPKTVLFSLHLRPQKMHNDFLQISWPFLLDVGLVNKIISRLDGIWKLTMSPTHSGSLESFFVNGKVKHSPHFSKLMEPDSIPVNGSSVTPFVTVPLI